MKPLVRVVEMWYDRTVDMVDLIVRNIRNTTIFSSWAKLILVTELLSNRQAVDSFSSKPRTFGRQEPRIACFCALSAGSKILGLRAVLFLVFSGFFRHIFWLSFPLTSFLGGKGLLPYFFSYLFEFTE